jgi:hypothetical protein
MNLLQLLHMSVNKNIVYAVSCYKVSIEVS